jgi:DNA-binding transcriptional ArsR family regulator
MTHHARFAEVAALAGDPTRAAMLQALMDGRALTASELARVASVTPQTASDHLARLRACGLICVEKQGRHRYHRLASAAVAHMIESIMQVAAAGGRPALVTGPRDAAMRAARTCYDHFAGRLGIALADGLTAAGHVELTHDSGRITPSGMALLHGLGLDLAAMPPGRGSRGGLLCRPCLDWSERRPHLAGTLGAALCTLALERGWVRRLPGTRAVAVTGEGRRCFAENLGVRLDA